MGIVADSPPDLRTTIALAVHRWATLTDESRFIECQVENERQEHWPCWNLGLAILRALDEAGIRKSPSDLHDEGRWIGRLDGLYAALEALGGTEDILEVDLRNPDLEERIPTDKDSVRRIVERMIYRAQHHDPDWRRA
jgi:hypothetical protein